MLGVEDGHPAGPEDGQGQRQHVGQGVVEAGTAQGAQDVDGRGPPPDGGAQGQLKVGLVLLPGGDLEGAPSAGEGRPGLGVERVEVAHDHVGRPAQGPGGRRPAVRGDHQGRREQAGAGPGAVAQVTVRDDQGIQSSPMIPVARGDAPGNPPVPPELRAARDALLQAVRRGLGR